jgi:8-oxo-(d)GTP phosphatase
VEPAPGRRGAVLMLLLRHAWAGHKETWVGDDDRDRPLDERGRAQAEELVERLAPYTIEAIYTSPYRRCVQTVEPLAAALDLAIEKREELSEELQDSEGAELVRVLAGRDVVVCGHGGLERAVQDPPDPWEKGAVLVIGPALEIRDSF